MLAAEVASSTGLDGHHDDSVNDGFSFLGGTHRFFIVNAADGVTPVGDDHHYLPPLPAVHRMRAQVDGVVKRGSGAVVNPVDAAVYSFQIRGKGHNFIHRLA